MVGLNKNKITIRTIRKIISYIIISRHKKKLVYTVLLSREATKGRVDQLYGGRTLQITTQIYRVNFNFPCNEYLIIIVELCIDCAKG
jgi:hypothetical protein